VSPQATRQGIISDKLPSEPVKEKANIVVINIATEAKNGR
jgi:hypothetical protein|tara:strand:+ start:424 stop:543 length:120 start_codon:yes stop_codon:yes gene_type:complete